MTIAFPDIIPTDFEFRLVSNTQIFKSPLSGSVQTLELPGARWAASLNFKARRRDDEATRIFSAFLAKLRGMAGTFYLYDYNHPYPAGVATGTPVVSGAGQTGTSLVTSGWTNSITGILKAGDYIQVGDELKMVVADANSNGSGNSTLTIEPPWRSSPADASSIITTKPKCIMRLAEPSVGWSCGYGSFKDFVTISCVEDF